MDVNTLGQAFVDWTYEADPDWYDDEDGAPTYVVSYGSDNVHWGEVEEIFYSWKDPIVKVVEGSEVRLVEQVGGEGEGENYYLVFEVRNPDGTVQFFRVDGYYASYEGTSWDGAALREVKAVVRPVTFYE